MKGLITHGIIITAYMDENELSIKSFKGNDQIVCQNSFCRFSLEQENVKDVHLSTR
jgi:hypothetical protein